MKALIRRGTIFGLACWMLASPLKAQTSTDIAVVVNSRSTVNNISSTDLRRIFSGEQRYWPGGVRIKLIVRQPGSHEWLALLRLLRMSDSEYKQYWTAQVFRGEAEAEPLSLPSFGMVKEAVPIFPGSISLAENQQVKPGMDLKIIKVDGRLPGESGYPLH